MAVRSPANYNAYLPMAATSVVAPVPAALPAVSPTDTQRLPKTNPPFSGTVAGKTAPTASGGRTGASETLVRGYIRRTDEFDRKDPTAPYRLNFMFNPESIQRSFISYLDQNALDPFNTVHGSGNVMAPPGILDFSFELLFDRQLEVYRDDNHPGTKVDYDYFDLVVRGVDPRTAHAGPNSPPDNGVMMVNPRNITAVFGPELVVTGKAFNASVSLDKFSHKMTPTRIRILLQMKVLSIGPRPLSYTYQTAQQQKVVAATVPYDNKVTVTETNPLNVSDLLKDGSDAFLASLGLDGSGALGTLVPGGPATGGVAGGGGAAWNGPVDEQRILRRIRNKESTNNYTAQNPSSSASGAYQFTNDTWDHFKGYARAKDAPPSVQDEKALNNVRYFLSKYHNILESVPASWYAGHYAGHGKLDYVPGGPGNGGKKVQTYVDEWLAEY